MILVVLTLLKLSLETRRLLGFPWPAPGNKQLGVKPSTSFPENAKLKAAGLARHPQAATLVPGATHLAASPATRRSSAEATRRMLPRCPYQDSGLERSTPSLPAPARPAGPVTACFCIGSPPVPSLPASPC